MARPLLIEDQRLFEAVRTVLLGQPRLTTARVAEVAGVSEGILFKRFGSKNGLLAAVMEDTLARLLARIDAHGGGPCDLRWLSALAFDVLGHVRLFVPMALAHMGEGLEASQLQGEDPPPLRVAAALARMFREQMERGGLRASDAGACARTFLGGLWQYAFEEALLRARGRTPGQSAEDFVTALASLFWEGLGPFPSIPSDTVRTGDPA
jgi:AcrR family transcriptional regulator